MEHSYNLSDIEADMHGCVFPGCQYADAKNCYDDEPYCFTHSPDSGSSFFGYSFKRGDPVPQEGS